MPRWSGLSLPKRLMPIVLPVLVSALYAFGIQPHVDIEEIVKRSIDQMRTDLKAAPEFSYIERDLETRNHLTTIKTYKVMMIEGSPYRGLIRVNDQPISRAQDALERRKLVREIARRANESSAERTRRVAQYKQDQQHELALMSEMAAAFQFQLVGEKQIDGHQVYDLSATPRLGYQPRSRETRVLTGMRGELYIDEDTCQWVKVEAVAFKPVWFGWFIAKVNPGTRFRLDQAPVAGNIWLPTHFRDDVKATILWFNRFSTDDETYSDYQRVGTH